MVRLIAEREIRQRLRGKAFIITSAALVVVVIAMGVIQRVGSGDDEIRDVTIGVRGEVPDDFDAVLVAAGQAIDLDITTETVDSSDAARVALDDGDVDAVFDADAAKVLYDDEEDTTVQAALRQAWASESVRGAMEESGLSDDEIQRILTPPDLAANVVDENDDDAVGVVVGMAVSILLFISLQTFGGYVLMGVVEEKSTAVVEVLLARVKATDLLAGKIAGIGIVALIQFALALAAGFVALMIADVDVPLDVWTSLPWAAVWFLGGFAFYCTLFGLAGSLVSRQEDAQGAVMPIGMTMLVAYLAMFTLIGDPQSTAARIVSVLPPFAPLVMPMRIATGAASIVEIAISLVALVLAIIGVAKLAGMVYAQVLLHRGTRIGWRAALRTARTRGAAQ